MEAKSPKYIFADGSNKIVENISGDRSDRTWGNCKRRMVGSLSSFNRDETRAQRPRFEIIRYIRYRAPNESDLLFKAEEKLRDLLKV